MRPPTDLDRRLSAWLDEDASLPAPAHVLPDALARTSRTRPRPAWLIPERWIPMRISMALAVIPRAVLIVLTMLIVLALVASAYVIGAPTPARLPSPTGLARNGLIAWDAGGDIWVANPDGSGAHPITSGPGVDIDPVWSPDGTRLAYWSLVDTDPSLALTAERASDLLTTSFASLNLLDVPGGAPTTLVSGVRLNKFAWSVSWAPDSALLVYGAADGLTMSVWTIGLEGGVPVRLAEGDAPAWSPDGGRIAYSRVGGPAAVMLIGADGTGPTRLTQGFGAGIAAFMRPQWSPDGSRIAYQTGSAGAQGIWLIGADGTNEHAISDPSHNVLWPSWSPDGLRISYMNVPCCGPDTSGGGYVVVDPDGANEVALVGPFCGPPPATWSPDGTMLLQFTEEPFEGHEPGVVLMAASGGDPSVVVSIPTDSLGCSSSWQRLAP